MADIFVSYATEDRERVRPLVELLEREGWSVWWDRQIHAGPRFDQIIEEAIDQAYCVVAVWSRHSIQSDWVRTEANEGLERGILVPMRIDDVRPPLAFRRSQTADLVGFPRHRRGLDVLLSGVRETIQKPGRVGDNADDLTAGEHDQRTEAVSFKIRQKLVGGASVAIVTIAVWAGWVVVGGESNQEPIRSIAVLPLENLSNDDEQEHFADGTTDLLIQDLGKISAIHRVISRVSVMRYKNTTKTALEIANELGVDGLLTGTITPAGDRVRITLQLYDAKRDQDIWSERYERPFDDIFKLQNTIARTVAEELDLALSGNEISSLSSSRTVNPASHDAFLLGRNYAFRDMDGQALQLLEQAIELDSSNADAYAEIARLRSIEIWLGASPRELYPEVQRYNDLALANDPHNVHGRATKALLTFFKDLSYQDGIDQFSRLLNSYPNDTDLMRYYIYALRALDRNDLALNLAQRRVEIGPFDPNAYVSLGESYEWLGMQEEARDSYLVAESLGRPLPAQLATVAAAMEDKTALKQQLMRGQETWGSNAVWMGFFEAYLSYLEGDETQIQELLREHEEHDVDIRFWWPESLFHRLIGDIDQAVTYYARAIERLEPQALMRIHGSIWERRDNHEFYADPRYKEIQKRIGLSRGAAEDIRVPVFPASIASGLAEKL